MNFGLIGVLVAAAGISAVFIYEKISNYLTDRQLAKQKAESDQKQKDYQTQVDQLQKEIQDAKLTFDINRRKLDSDSNSSK